MASSDDKVASIWKGPVWCSCPTIPAHTTYCTLGCCRHATNGSGELQDFVAVVMHIKEELVFSKHSGDLIDLLLRSLEFDALKSMLVFPSLRFPYVQFATPLS